MQFHRRTLCSALAAGCLVVVGSHRGLRAEDHGGPSQEPFGFDPVTGWFEEPHHSHLSQRGTPMIHSFRLEPAFTHRDLFLDYGYRSGPEGYEQEIEVELEWALTRRIGLVVEVPYIFESPDGGMDVDGFGDLAFSPRLLLAEFNRFLLSFALEVEMPTGDEDRGFSDDEWKLAPNFSAWFDLGGWTSLNTQIGVERALESDSSELIVRASLIHTLGGPGKDHDDNHDHDHDHAHGHGHLEPGHLSLILEAEMIMGLTEEEDGVVEAEGIFGLYYGLSENTDVRIGYQFPLSEPRELDSGVTVGLVHHF